MSASKVRVHEISRLLGVSNAVVIDVLAKEFNVQAKSHSSTVDQDVADRLIASLKKSGNAVDSTEKSKAAPAQKTEAPEPASSPSAAKSVAETKDAVKTEPTKEVVKEPAQEVKQQPVVAKQAPSPTQTPPVQRTTPPAQTTTPSEQHLRRPGHPNPPSGSRMNESGRPRPQQQVGHSGNMQSGRPGGQGGSHQGGGNRPHGTQSPTVAPRPASLQTPTRIVPEPPPGASPPPQRPMRAHAQAQQNARPAQQQPPQQQQFQQPVAQQQQQTQTQTQHQRPSFPPSGSHQGPGSGSPHHGGGKRPGHQHHSKNQGSRNAERTSSFSAREAREREREEEAAAAAAVPKIVRIDEALTVRELAIKLNLRETEVIKHMFMKGMMVTVNQTLDIEFARTVAKEFEFEVEETAEVSHEGEYSHLASDDAKKLDETKFLNLSGRSPVVSIMGHVDHGKTTLLDAIRETRHKIVDSEAGGITQSIGAYTVQKGDQRIVFLDTPGHEAFTSMRMRGAQATDIAILVVAADDGVMPQTIEAINHAKVAKIPIIVAVNKIDKADADPDKVLVQLADYGLSAEKWGGDTLTVEVSALQKLGLDDILDSVLLVSELLELKADATVPGEGVIIEAQLDKRMGPMATALVRNGMLKVGDNVLLGSVGGRVRALIDDHGQRVTQAGPSTPVSILGLDGVPNAGDAFKVVRNDKVFKQELAQGKQRQRDERIGVTRSVAGFSGRLEADENKESQFNLLVKADTQGSLEAVMEVLQRMTSDEIKINIVHSATGDISEADVMLASTANALVIGFNTKADANMQRMAEQSGVAIKRYDVIYHITEDIEKWVLGQLSPEIEEAHAGTAEIRQIFKVGKSSVIAGCMVTQGKIIRNAKARVLRDGQEIFTGPLTNLKRFKDDAKEVAAGYECGISFERFHDLQEGDMVEVYTTKALERTSL